MNMHHQALALVGKVYIHPISKDLVVFTECVGLEMLIWRQVSGNKSGRVLAGTVLTDDGRWQIFTGTGGTLLPYSYRR